MVWQTIVGDELIAIKGVFCSRGWRLCTCRCGFLGDGGGNGRARRTFPPLAPKLGTAYNTHMRIIARKTLKEFWEIHSDAEQPHRSWFAKASQANWQTPADVEMDYRHASFVANNRIVFNIKGNDYRLVAAIKYEYSVVYIRFVGTHQAYDRIDATTI